MSVKHLKTEWDPEGRVQLLLELNRAIFAAQDPFEMVRAYGELILKESPHLCAVLSWPDSQIGFNKPIRKESLGKASALPEGSKKVYEVRFFDGDFAFIKIEFFMDKPEKFPKDLSSWFDHCAKNVNSAIFSFQEMKLQEEMKRFNAIRTLSAGLAHEINTPLNTLLFYVKEQEKAGSAKSISRIKVSAERISEVITHLRRFTGDGESTELETSDLREILKNVAQDFSKKEAGKPKLIVETPSEEILIKARPGHIEEALSHLIQNSREAHERDPKSDERWIRVSAELHEGKVRIKVTDNGPGIPIQNYSNLFDPFFSTKDVNQGLGLGLSIARAILFSHNGTIRFNSLSQQTQFILEMDQVIKSKTKAKGKSRGSV